MCFAALSRVGAPPEEQWPNQWIPRFGFAKAHGVAPGAAVGVTLRLVARDFSRWDAAAGAFTVRPGAFSIALRDGGSVEFSVTEAKA